MLKIKKQKKLITDIKKAFNILSNPRQEFDLMWGKNFEDLFNSYLRLLLGVSILTGIAIFLYDIFRALYYMIFTLVDVRLLRMLNYSFGKATGLILFYLFAGTFILFLISIIIKLISKKIKYPDLVRILFYSLSPLLLFAWIPITIVPLIIWCIFLYIQGIHSYKQSKKKKVTNTILQRE